MIRIVVSLLLAFSSVAAPTDEKPADHAKDAGKHILEDEMLAGVTAFWKLVMDEAPLEEIEWWGSHEKFAAKLVDLVKKEVPYGKEKAARLRANKPIRTPVEIAAMIGKIPDADGGNERKAKLSAWFKDETIPETRKEVMYFLMHFIVVE